MRVRSKRRLLVLRVVGIVATILAIATLALLSKPGWREYFAEVGVVLGALIVCRMITNGTRGRFLADAASPFEWALRSERRDQKTPSQLGSALSMAAMPDRATFDLLASAMDRRLYDRHGFGLNDERARDAVGTEVFELLHIERQSGQISAVPRTSRGFLARWLSVLPSAITRRVAVVRSSSSTAERAGSIEQVRTILNRLEQL